MGATRNPPSKAETMPPSVAAKTCLTPIVPILGRFVRVEQSNLGRCQGLSFSNPCYQAVTLTKESMSSIKRDVKKKSSASTNRQSGPS